MINFFLLTTLILLNTIAAVLRPVAAKPDFGGEVTPEQIILYHELTAENQVAMPPYEVFELAYRGYSNLRKKHGVSRNILSIADFSKASTEKRLWVIDMDSRKVLFHDYVAHGRNSGENYAGKFSNVPNSNMSSIGFYITGETYTGKHGLSLYLNGVDTEFNGKARERAIVIHGAEYVSQDYINKYGRLGRSYGCPALSMENYKPIIDTIQKGSCLFIYYPDEEFLRKSAVLNSSSDKSGSESY